MRYRSLGNSDLIVSEVGFGTWTLVTDWWGRTDDPHDMIKAALDAGITFLDTAPVYGNEGAGETILADYLSHRDDLVLTTKVGYDITAERKFPGQSERPHDWESASVRRQVEDSLRRLGTDRIDLVAAAQSAHRADRRRLRSGTRSSRCATKARCASSASRSARRSDGSKKATARSTTGPIVSLQTVFNVLEQEPGPHVRAAGPRRERRGRADRASPARVRHALGQDHARYRVPEGRPSRAPQSRQHARQLREGRNAWLPLDRRDRPHDRTSRHRRDSRQPGVRVRAARRCFPSTRCASTPPPPIFRSRRRDERCSTICGRETSTTSTVTSCR